MLTLLVDDVTLGYGERVVLQNITFEAKPGEMVGIIGPNGCGKSTLLKAITRLIEPYSGHIFVDGRDVKSIKRQELATLIAVVPQNPTLPELFTSLEVVLMGRTPYLGYFRYESEKDFAIAWQAMEKTKTAAFSERRTGELSGGERQRLTIARALAQEPKIILLDEPTANLDINFQMEILDFISELCSEQGILAIVALHDLNLAAQYCQRLFLLHNGQIHIEGSPRTVITAENIKEVYGAEVCVYPHPINNLPATLIVPAGDRLRGKKVS